MLDRSNAFLVVVGLAGVGLLLVSGVGPVSMTGPAADGSPGHDPASLVSNMTDAKPDYVEGELSRVTARNGSELERTDYAVVERPNGEQWRVHIDGDDTNLTIVANETTIWQYDATEDEAVRTDRNDQEVIVPAMEFDHYADVTDDFEMQYEGIDRVADRPAHVVVFTDPGETEPTASIELLVGEHTYRLAGTAFEEPLVFEEHRLWLDRETEYPLKERTEMVSPDGETVTFTTEYHRIRFDGTPSSDIFEFEPPADAEVRSSPSFNEFDSIEVAQEAVSLAIPDPEIPAGFELRTVAVREVDHGTLVFLVFDDGTDRLTVATMPPQTHEVEGVSVDVDGTPGTVVDTVSGGSIHWSCGGRSYRVVGTLSTDEQLDVAESINCE